VRIQSITANEIKNSGGNAANNWAEPVKDDTPAGDIPPLVVDKNLGSGNMMAHPVRASLSNGDYTRFRITMSEDWDNKQFKPGFPGTSSDATSADPKVAKSGTNTNKDSSSLYISAGDTGDATLSYTSRKSRGAGRTPTVWLGSTRLRA